MAKPGGPQRLAIGGINVQIQPQYEALDGIKSSNRSKLASFYVESSERIEVLVGIGDTTKSGQSYHRSYITKTIIQKMPVRVLSELLRVFLYAIEHGRYWASSSMHAVMHRHHI